MDRNNIISKRNKILGYIRDNRLRDAFKELRLLILGQNSWQLSYDIDRVEESYKLMLRYASDGVDDPGRKDIYDDIIESAYTLVDRITRDALKAVSSSLYFNTLRYEETQSSNSISELLCGYSKLRENSSLYNMITSENQVKELAKTVVKDMEQLEKRLFNVLWVTYPLSTECQVSIEDALLSTSYPRHFKQLMVSALLMGLLEYYDERRLHILLTLYAKGDETLSIKALCALLIAMYCHKSRNISNKLKGHLMSVKELPKWHDDVQTVFLQFIRTRDTERINKRMREELIPQMLKLRPDIYKKINDNTSVIDMSSIEENPEWQEILDSSGISDKIRELSEMQQDGGDVFMSTFAQLKSFPFFADISNWFLPFHVDHSIVSESLGENSSVISEIISSSPFLCNSDKYSFVLTFKSVPVSQREMMMNQFNSQNINVAELQNADLTPSNKIRENIANKYVQDLYRFFKLFRRKGEFFDPFSTPLNLVQVPELAADFNDTDTLALVSEFYFNRKYYSDAFELFKLLCDKMPPSFQLYQKMGYCCQQEGHVDMALRYYEQSELLNADSIWTLRRIAGCYKLLNMPSKALEYYIRVEEKKPDDLTIALNMGHCLMELGRYDEAMKYYFKVDFLDDKSSRAWRPLAWCALLSGDLAQSKKYYDKVLTDNPSSEDYLNMGHLALAANKTAEAIKYYRSSLDHDGGDVEKFVKSINNDIRYLKQINVDIAIIPLLIDSLLYSIDEK